jgi:hypothetical protein
VVVVVAEPVTTTTSAGGSIYASQAMAEASQACSGLSAFDASVAAEVEAGHSKGGNTSASAEPGAAAAAATAYGYAYQAHEIATTHLTGMASSMWDDFALSFALLDASLGGNPTGSGQTSATDPTTAANDYADAAGKCTGIFGSTFPSLSS